MSQETASPKKTTKKYTKKYTKKTPTIQNAPAWYLKQEIVENLITIPASSILVTDSIHRKGQANVPLNPKAKNTVAVNDNGDGTYTLLVGVNSCIRGKLYNTDVLAYVTDDDRETFKNKHQLDV